MLYSHHTKANPSYHTCHDAHKRDPRRPGRCIGGPHGEPSRSPCGAVRALNAKARDAAQTAADTGRGRGRVRRGAAVGHRRTAAHHHRDPVRGAGPALQVGGARGVVVAALRDGARAGRRVGEARDNVGEREVGVGDVARTHACGGGRAVGRRGGPRAHVARGAASGRVGGVEGAGLPTGAADAAVGGGGALGRAAVGACDAAAAARLSGEEGFGGDGVVALMDDGGGGGGGDGCFDGEEGFLFFAGADGSGEDGEEESDNGGGQGWY